MNTNGSSDVLEGVFGGLWHHSTLNAQCRSVMREEGEGHHAPHRDCTCGIYGLPSIKETKKYMHDARLTRDVIGLASLPILLGMVFSLARLIDHLSNVQYVILFDLAMVILSGIWIWGWPTAVHLILKREKGYKPEVIGAVAMRGKTLVYKEGLRAENARILCFLQSRELTPLQHSFLKEKYQVPIFSSEVEANNYLREHAVGLWNEKGHLAEAKP